MPVRLHVNVDHVATLRQARGTPYPDPVRAALLCEQAGAHGITVHLREDRRHIQDRDVEALRTRVRSLLNLEMAATAEMVGIATRIRPDIVTLVPERREERTTEGGLSAASMQKELGEICRQIQDAGIGVSLFIDPEEHQVRASIALGVQAVEFHTGDYAGAEEGMQQAELDRLVRAAGIVAKEAESIRVAAGHGLTVDNVGSLVSVMPGLRELNIGHAVIADSIFVGIEQAVRNFLEAIRRGEQGR